MLQFTYRQPLDLLKLIYRMTYTLEKQTMTKAKVVKFLELLSETDLPIVTMMPLLHDTLKAYIPSYEVWVFLVNEQMEPTEYYGEKTPKLINKTSRLT